MEGYTDLRALTAGLCSRRLVGRVTTSLPSEIHLTRIFNFFFVVVCEAGGKRVKALTAEEEARR